MGPGHEQLAAVPSFPRLVERKDLFRSEQKDSEFPYLHQLYCMELIVSLIQWLYAKFAIAETD